MVVSCLNCGVAFNKSPGEIARTKHNFCSRRCAAAVTNKVKKNFVKGSCSKCGSPISKSLKYCPSCRPERRIELDHLTKGEVRQKFRNYHQVMRVDSRRKKMESLTSPASCMVCCYATFVEVAHVVAVEAFPDSALVAVINATTNTVLLCPNHHKEFDAGILKLKG